MIASILINLAGIVVFLFIFWMRLKEDYSSELIFKIAFYILLGILIGSLFSRLLPKYYLWIELACSIVGAGVGIVITGVRPFEVIEAFILSVLPWLSICFLKDSVGARSLTSFLAFVATLIIIFEAYLLDTRYKSFSWYVSGKIGFVGLVTFISIFIIRFCTSFLKIPVLSFVKYEAIFSGLGIVACSILLVYLAKDKE